MFVLMRKILDIVRRNPAERVEHKADVISRKSDVISRDLKKTKVRVDVLSELVRNMRQDFSDQMDSGSKNGHGL